MPFRSGRTLAGSGLAAAGAAALAAAVFAVSGPTSEGAPPPLTTQVAVATVPMGSLSGSSTNATATCPAGSVLVGGGIRQFDTLVAGAETNGLKANGSLPGDASGDSAANGSTDPASWTAVGGFGGVGETGDDVSSFGMCASGGGVQAAAGPSTTVVVSSIAGQGTSPDTSEVHVTATCPAGTTLVGGGALGTPAGVGNFKPIASFPSSAGGVAALDGAADPTSWTVVGAVMGALNSFGVTTTAFAVCSYDTSLATVVHVTTELGQAPPAGSGPGGSTPELPPITASCAAGTTLVAGGVQYLANGGYPAQGDGYYGFHLVGDYPSDASGNPVPGGAAGPSSWTAVVHPGGISIASIDEYAYALCASTGTTVTGADLVITNLDAPDPVTVGSALTYSQTVANAGPDTATGVVTTDVLPPGVTFGSASSTAGSCAQAAGTITCSLGALAAGASASIALTVTPTVVTADLANTVSVASGVSDPAPANNLAVADTQVIAVVIVPPPSADLSIRVNGSADPVTVGADLTYTLAVTNGGPSAASAIATDVLPASVTYVSAVASQGPGCTEAGQPGGTVTCPLGALVAGASAIATIVVTPRAAASLTNSASVSSGTADPDAGNNSATLSTQANAAPAAGGGGGGGGATTTTTATPTTTTATTTTTTTPASSGGAPHASKLATPGTSGSVSISTGSGGSVSVAWPAGGIAGKPVTVSLAAAAGASSSGGFAAGTAAVAVAVSGGDGTAIAELGAPLDIAFANAPAGVVPAYSHDGKTWTAIPQLLAPPTLPAGWPDGWYRDQAGTLHILTLHTTYFAALSRKSKAAPALALSVRLTLRTARAVALSARSTLPGTLAISLARGGKRAGSWHETVTAKPAGIRLVPARPLRAGSYELTLTATAGRERATKVVHLKIAPGKATKP